MGFLIGVVLVLFVFASIFLILLVMVQSGKGGSLGGMGGGASQTAFGSSSADIMTKATRFIAVFFVASAFALSFLFAKKETISEVPTNETPMLESSKDAKEVSPSKDLPSPSKETVPPAKQ